MREAEAQVVDITDRPRGSLYVSAPLGVRRRLIAPQVPTFPNEYPEVSMRLRLSNRKIDLTTEDLDLAFFLGQPEDSTLRIRKVADVQRVLCAAPAYIAARGHSRSGDDIVGDDIVSDGHECLNLRFPGATEFQWPLITATGPKRFRATGRFECDDGDVLVDWALSGHGIALKLVFDVAEHLKADRLVMVAEETPPEPIQIACLFVDFGIDRIGHVIKQTRISDQLPR